MTEEAKRIISLEKLGEGISVLLDEMVGFYRLSCMVCLDSNNHTSGVTLTVHYNKREYPFQITWDGLVTDEQRRALNDEKKCVDNAACAMALNILQEMTEYTAYEQSAIGTTIDYYLQPKDADDTLIFNGAARLEVSGILKENPATGNTVEKRYKEKLRRLHKEEGYERDYIIIVEFSVPWSKMGYHE